MLSASVADRLRLARLDATAIVSTILLFGSFTVLAVIIAGSGVRVDWTGMDVCIAFSVASWLLGLTLKLVDGSPRIANFALVAATLIGSTMCNTVSLNAGLRLQFPLVDAQLRAADAFTGLDSVALVQAFANYPALNRLLNLVYVNSNWLAVVVVLVHAVRPTGAARALACYAGSLLLVTIVSTLLPAIGNIAYSNLMHLHGNGLPADSGTYHLDIFRYYRAGGDLVDNAHLTGVAVFPSFHTIMGLIIATSLHGTRAAPLGLAFGAATIVSTMPIGGHYVIDIFGGIATWALVMWLAGRTRSAAAATPFVPTIALPRPATA